MQKDMIFFGENGLTSSSANHVANLSKEAYQQIEKELSNIRFIDKTMSLIGQPNEQLISEGVRTVSDIDGKLGRVASLKSLIAWLREGIKSKERLLEEVNHITFEDCGFEIPEQPEAPKKEAYIQEDDVIGTWGIKQRNRYYYLETLCAQIGKFIHPDGWFTNARNNMFDAIHNPRTVSGSGRDAVVYHYVPSIDVQEVEDEFMSLQDKYRSYQAELNGMKHEIEVALENDKIAKDSEYKEKWQTYQGEYDKYSHQLVELSNKLTEVKNQKLAELQKLKIIIPDSLKPIYEEVSKLGKK
jgi:hypothetical protein